MPFHFTCPHCHLKSLVDDKFSGQSGPCAGCGKTVSIPSYKKTAQAQPSETVDLAVQASNQKQIRLIRWVLGVAGMALLMVGIYVALLPALQYAATSRKQGICLNHMRQIANALNAYANTYGTYPPATTYDSKGKALYSWRVLILPQLGYKELYSQFNRDQPWDSVTNLRIVQEMPDVFASPGSPDALALGESNYVLITGGGTLFPSSGPASPTSVTDLPSQTILVAETANSGKSWTQPADIDIKNGLKLGTRAYVDLGGNHEAGANVVTVDGTAMVLPPDISPEMIYAMATPNGNEAINTQGLERK